ncbi:MAG: hypothetical protein KA099_03495 [Alphaproteobacteria bacterium]|nr:hypothetical protein [Alphaproteobacteria bacterium]MBP7758476.1 hypothetical protein [Alphaproteobacteria bacterium]MBP7762757.1 hypothetical protein [Alphaproteobacteria bacterium]MBP7904369.1 hypothetical protein [Alphaproteobacteria bacterium]
MRAFLDIRVGRYNRIEFLIAYFVFYFFIFVPLFILLMPVIIHIPHEIAQFLYLPMAVLASLYFGLLIEVRRLRDLGTHPFPAVIGLLSRLYIWALSFSAEALESGQNADFWRSVFAFLLSNNPLNSLLWIVIAGYYLILIFRKGSAAAADGADQVGTPAPDKSSAEIQDFKGRG